MALALFPKLSDGLVRTKLCYPVRILTRFLPTWFFAHRGAARLGARSDPAYHMQGTFAIE
jgi:hypothetical protein